MKTACIIFGFQYQGKYRIPGILIDMFRAYQFATKADMDVMVITDIHEDQDNKDLIRGFHKKNCDARIFSFIQSLKESGAYLIWESLKDIQNAMFYFLHGKRRLFFYYSGHSVQTKFLFPDLQLVPTTEVIRLDPMEPKSQIFFLLDCCNSSYLDLPFLMAMDYSVSRYRTTAIIKGGVYHIHTQDYQFTGHDVLCISSSMADENASATWVGSTFTQLFFQALEDEETRNIHAILKKVQQVMKGKQSCRAYASFPYIHALFPWLFNPEVSSIRHSDHGIVICLNEKK